MPSQNIPQHPRRNARDLRHSRNGAFICACHVGNAPIHHVANNCSLLMSQPAEGNCVLSQSHAHTNTLTHIHCHHHRHHRHINPGMARRHAQTPTKHRKTPSISYDSNRSYALRIRKRFELQFIMITRLLAWKTMPSFEHASTRALMSLSPQIGHYVFFIELLRIGGENPI